MKLWNVIFYSLGIGYILFIIFFIVIPHISASHTHYIFIAPNGTEILCSGTEICINATNQSVAFPTNLSDYTILKTNKTFL